MADWSSSIISEFDVSLEQLVSKFDSDLSAFVTQLSNQVSASSIEPTSTRDVINRTSSAFSVGLGDADTGFYGSFYKSIDVIIKKATDDINAAASGTIFTTQNQVDAFQNKSTQISDHITSAITAAGEKLGKLVEAASNTFTLNITRVQETTSRVYVTSIVDSCLAAIKRSETHAVESFNTLIGVLEQYKMLPSGVYDDSNTIITKIYDDYSKSIESAFAAFNTAVSSYDLYTETSAALLEDGNTRIDVALTASQSFLSAQSSRLSSVLQSISPYVEPLVIDYVVSQKISKSIAELYTESIKLRNSIRSLDKDIASDAEVVVKSLERYFINAYVPVFVDSSSYRDNKQRVVSGAYDILSDAQNNLNTKYSDRISVLSNNFNTYSGQLQDGIVSYINDKIPTIPTEQSEYIIARFSRSSSMLSTRISSYFDSSTKLYNHISSSLQLHLDKLIKKYYDELPLLQYTGYIESPPVINDTDYNKFRFDVKNVGKRPWIGWFGIRILSAIIDDDDDETTEYIAPYFIWNKQFVLYSILPGQIKNIVVSVHGPQIFNFDDLLGGIKWSVIVNTHNGVNKAWLKKS